MMNSNDNQGRKRGRPPVPHVCQRCGLYWSCTESGPRLSEGCDRWTTVSPYIKRKRRKTNHDDKQ